VFPVAAVSASTILLVHVWGSVGDVRPVIRRGKVIVMQVCTSGARRLMSARTRSRWRSGCRRCEGGFFPEMVKRVLERGMRQSVYLARAEGVDSDVLTAL